GAAGAFIPSRRFRRPRRWGPSGGERLSTGVSEAPKLGSIARDPEVVETRRKGTQRSTMAGPIPDIRTLRAICHSGKLTRDRRRWYVLQRRVTIYLTWLVLHTGLEANHVTAITVICALAGSVPLRWPSPAPALT